MFGKKGDKKKKKSGASSSAAEEPPRQLSPDPPPSDEATARRSPHIPHLGQCSNLPAPRPAAVEVPAPAPANVRVNIASYDDYKTGERHTVPDLFKRTWMTRWRRQRKGSRRRGARDTAGAPKEASTLAAGAQVPATEGQVPTAEDPSRHPSLCRRNTSPPRSVEALALRSPDIYRAISTIYLLLYPSSCSCISSFTDYKTRERRRSAVYGAKEMQEFHPAVESSGSDGWGSGAGSELQI
ncbi:hypothetical protein H6P81_017074 [Aristolochia fimbriata]|uniref:Uncharacterized protein n=1 Tax=Aristolochia fimbriata TaxID=158543 RepID=A0AAV7DZ56_ARIFI|nr:hypothetical protein H6P81_017074 [Aristolochia fimbriata]